MPCCGLLGTQKRVRDSRKTREGSGEDEASRVADGLWEASRSRQEKVDRDWGQTVGEPLAPGMRALLVQGCAPSGEQGWTRERARTGDRLGSGLSDRDAPVLRAYWGITSGGKTRSWLTLCDPSSGAWSATPVCFLLPCTR